MNINQSMVASIATCLLLGYSHFAHAQSGYSIEAIAQARHDTNLLRDDKASLPAAGSCRSDDIGRLQSRLTGVWDDGMSVANVTGGPYRESYRCNTRLDFTGYEMFGTIQHPAADPISISLSFVGLRQRSSFADARVDDGNIQNFFRVSGQAALALTPELRLVAEPRFVASTNNNPLFRAAGYHSYGASVGLGWYTPLENSIVFRLSRTITRGLHPRLVRVGNVDRDSPIDLADTAVGAELVYHPSVLTRAEASLFYVRRRDASVLVQDYDGMTGSVKLVYTPNELLSVAAEAGKRLSNNDFLFVDSIRDTYFEAHIVRKIGYNSEIGAKINYEKQILRFDFVQDARQNESFRKIYLDLTAACRVVDILEVRATMRREWGKGTLSDPTYKATVALLALSYKFGTLR